MSSRSALFLFCAFLGSAFLWSACAWPSDQDYLAPPNDDELHLLSSDPAAGSRAVLRDKTLVLSFDAPIDPTSVDGRNVRLSSGTRIISAARAVDLVRCQVQVAPHDPLRGLLQHQLAILDLRSVAGARLTEPVTVGFETADATGGASAPTVPTLTELVVDVFLPRCGSCHGPSDPDAGLDLSTAPAAAQGLIHRESLYRPGQVLVTPGAHASSYLVWKMLDLPGIFGDRMPPERDWPSRTCDSPDPDMVRVAAWIDAGAAP